MFIYNLFATKGLRLGASISLEVSFNDWKVEVQEQHLIISPIIVNFILHLFKNSYSCLIQIFFIFNIFIFCDTPFLFNYQTLKTIT